MLNSKEKRAIKEMIRTETLFGVPLSEVTPEYFELLTEEEMRVLFVVSSMLHWQCLDNIVWEEPPDEAFFLLQKYQLKKT